MKYTDENKPKAIVDHENICFSCLSKVWNPKKYSIYGRGYGSDFDNFNTYLQVCEKCNKENLCQWFNETPKTGEYWEEYEHEDKIRDFVDSFPLQGKELFWNKCSYGANAYNMKSQDWIDDQLGILPDEVYEEEYAMYSPRQIKAYQERFPTCEYPVNKVYSDGSKGCWCPFGAIGDFGQVAGVNISDECFGCEFYKVRETPIKEMNAEIFDKYKLYMKGKQYKDLFE